MNSRYGRDEMNPTCLPHRTALGVTPPELGYHLPASLLMQPQPFSPSPLPPPRSHSTMFRVFIIVRPTESRMKSLKEYASPRRRSFKIPRSQRDARRVSIIQKCGGRTRTDADASAGNRLLLTFPEAVPHSSLSLSLSHAHDRCSKSFPDEFTSKGRFVSLNQAALLSFHPKKFVWE